MKSGEVVRYLAPAHNERNERGAPVARVIHNFGREDAPDRDALLGLVASIQRFLGGEDGLRAATTSGFDFLGAPESGGPHVVGGLWQELGIGEAIARVAGAGRSGVERAIFTMVCQRCPEPAYKLEAARWAGRDVVIDGIEGVSDDQLHRATDFLFCCVERVQESVLFSVPSVLNLEVDVIFFDTASTSWASDPAEEPAADGNEAKEEGAAREDAGPLRRLGHSRDHRPDRPPVVIGLAATREGVSVRCWVWPQNTNDQSVIEEVKANLSGWRLGHAIYMVDSGFSGQASVRHLRCAARATSCASSAARSTSCSSTAALLRRPAAVRRERLARAARNVRAGAGDRRAAGAHDRGAVGARALQARSREPRSLRPTRPGRRRARGAGHRDRQAALEAREQPRERPRLRRPASRGAARRKSRRRRDPPQ
ncbi:MAG TPA: hypothetical protein VKU89_03175 [Solirubrobacteraceae bacterium]|nr:hypothetical protein [Solirubrobacteraceae bacterium]